MESGADINRYITTLEARVASLEAELRVVNPRSPLMSDDSQGMGFLTATHLAVR